MWSIEPCWYFQRDDELFDDVPGLPQATREAVLSVLDIAKRELELLPCPKLVWVSRAETAAEEAEAVRLSTFQKSLPEPLVLRAPREVDGWCGTRRSELTIFISTDLDRHRAAQAVLREAAHVAYRQKHGRAADDWQRQLWINESNKYSATAADMLMDLAKVRRTARQEHRKLSSHRHTRPAGL